MTDKVSDTKYNLDIDHFKHRSLVMLSFDTREIFSHVVMDTRETNSSVYNHGN